MKTAKIVNIDLFSPDKLKACGLSSMLIILFDGLDPKTDCLKNRFICRSLGPTAKGFVGPGRMTVYFQGSWEN